MNNLLRTLIIFMLLGVEGSAQTAFVSESLLKYDLKTHQINDNKVIPFDRAFTLVVDKVEGNLVTKVHIYEANLENGTRLLVRNRDPSTYSSFCKTCKKDGSLEAKAIMDKELRFKGDANSLTIYVDPLRPNKLFDINVISRLSSKPKALAYQLNNLLYLNDTSKAQNAFNALDEALTDTVIRRSYLSLNLTGYRTFYTTQLEPAYRFLANVDHFPVAAFITLPEVQAIDLSAHKEKQESKLAHYLVEVIANGYGDDVQRGLVDILKAYEKDKKITMPYGHTRQAYLQSSLTVLDSLHRQLDWLIGKGYNDVTVAGTSISMEKLRLKLKTLRERMAENLEQLSSKMRSISDSIDANVSIRQGTYLAGRTISSELKTEGASVLFLDAGIAHMVVPGLNNTWPSIPRLYSGISIYFRPIDKNTRRSSFPKEFDPPKNCGCQSGTCGPDYGVITRASLWQHLCLNVGLTWGAIPNKDFDNFYNNMSLLVGPAYRFKRAFKVSSGVALLKRSSENPLVSDKKVVVGAYVSASVDVDFIQSIKDLTSILFK